MKSIAANLFLLGAAQAKSGSTFFVVGDYGYVTSMSYPNMVFDAINSLVSTATPGSIDAPEFFVAVGDNIYPSNAYSPTSTEFSLMFSLF